MTLELRTARLARAHQTKALRRWRAFRKRSRNLVWLYVNQIRHDQTSAGIFEVDGDRGLRVRPGGDVNTVHRAVAGSDIDLRTIEGDAAAVSRDSANIRDWGVGRIGLQVQGNQLLQVADDPRACAIGAHEELLCVEFARSHVNGMADRALSCKRTTLA